LNALRPIGLALGLGLVGLLAMGCDDSVVVDESVPVNALAALPRSYLVDMDIVWSDCRFEGWALSDGQARAAVTQNQSEVSWTQTGLDARGDVRSGDAWRFSGALCAESAVGEDGCSAPPTFESAFAVDAGVGDASMAETDASAENDETRFYLRMTVRTIERLSFGENVCRAELVMPSTRMEDCRAGCRGDTAEVAACTRRCEGKCTRCDALELPVKPCSCDVVHTYVEAAVRYEEGCAALPSCTIGMV